MTAITATFEGGVLTPTQPLDLPERASVRLTLELLPASPVTAANLNAFLEGLPPLGDDAAAFLNDIRAIRAEFPAEPISWE